MVQINLFNDSTRPQKNPKKIWTQNESNTGKNSDCNIKNRTAQIGTQKMTTHLTDITLRGYNDREQIFYVYDSNTKGVTEQYLMKGTVKIPYAVLLKSRSFGASKLLRNYAIGVEY